jgi:hypothetical protein
VLIPNRKRMRRCNIYDKKILEKRREQNLPTYLLFIDYERAYDGLIRDRIWKILAEEKIPPHLIEAIKSLYKNTVIRIKYMNDQISEPVTTN